MLGFLVVTLPSVGVGGKRVGPRAKSPDGTRVAEVRVRGVGGDGLYVDGKQVWPEPGAHERPKVVGAPVWSRSGDAVALVAKQSPGGETTLVVAILTGDAAGKALSWNLPAAALPARSITWLGPSRVAVGPREMDPKVVASWSVAR